MAKGNHQKNKRHSNEQASAKPRGKPSNNQPSEKPRGKHANKQPLDRPTGKPTRCETCGKLHNGECWNKTSPVKPVGICSHCGKKGHEESMCWNKNSSSRPAAFNCSHCGKKGHEESVCYKKNSNGKSKSNVSTSVTDKDQWTQFQFQGRVRALNCKREQDHSAVSFPLQLVGIMTKSSQESKPSGDVWIEDLDGDAIMCQHDCRENFCFKRFANKCAKQLSQDGIFVSRRDEEAIWKTMTNYGIPNNGFGQSSAMEIDEVF